MERTAIGLYIHIPFCLRKCPYCDFYSLPYSPEWADRYVSALLNAMEHHPFGTLQADTVYFGGGTPSILGAHRLTTILEAAVRHFSIPSHGEVTLEANPGTVTLQELRTLAQGGFNRISLGVQSLIPQELVDLGRGHTAQEAVEAMEAAHYAGFSNLSADLMLAIPGQTAESLAEAIEKLSALPIQHVSAYLLKVEEDTPFGRQNIERLCPSEDAAAQMYLDCGKMLTAQGFSWYEISNFARVGASCRHNLKYWRCEPYLGIGPSAHSFLAGERFYFPRSLQEFCLEPSPWDLRISHGAGGDFEEYAMLRLRLGEGLSLSQMAVGLGTDFQEIAVRAQPLVHQGLVEIQGDTLSLTPEGWLLSNAVTGKLLFP